MRRIAFILLCLTLISCGFTKTISPQVKVEDTTVSETQAETGQSLEPSKVMTLRSETPAELAQPLDSSRAAKILQDSLSSIPAAEILGQQLIDDLNMAINDLQNASPIPISGGSGRLATLARPPRNGERNCIVNKQEPFNQDGFSGEIVIKFCFETQEDRVTMDAQLSIQLQGTAPERLGQVLEVNISAHDDQDACPTAEGKTKGTFNADTRVTIKGANTSFGQTKSGHLDMQGNNAEDGSLESLDLGFIGSASFEVDGQSWNAPYDSQAAQVNAKDFDSIWTALISNANFTFAPPAPTMKITSEKIEKAVASSFELPLKTMMEGNQQAERHWWSINACVHIQITPEEFKLAPGESKQVAVEVLMNDDEVPVAAEIHSTPNGRGDRIDPETAHSSPGEPAEFTYTAKEHASSGSGAFQFTAYSKAGKAEAGQGVALAPIEWSGTFTMEGSATIPDVGTSQSTTTFTIRFQADLNYPYDSYDENDQFPKKFLFPFELEPDSTMTWSGTATALGITQPFSGSTSNLITPDTTDPMWLFSLPEGDYLAGEGYINREEMKLYLFLLGMGDNSGAGTFNLGPITNCSYDHDLATNRIYFVFDLDEDFKIADGSCWDQVPYESDSQSGTLSQSSRSWQFVTKYLSESQAAP